MDNTSNLPVAVDFSKTAIQRAVLQNTATHPLHTYPTAVGLLGVLADVAIPGVPFLLTVLGGTAVLFGVGGWVFQYFVRYDANVAKHLGTYNKRLRERAKSLVEYLAQEFAKLNHKHGVQLVERLEKQITGLTDVLDDKFDANDVTYRQFFGTAEELYLQTLARLDAAATQLKANKSMSVGIAKKQFQLYTEGEQRFGNLIASVEDALGGLAELTQRVARVSSDKLDHDTFLRDVRELASRASRFVSEKTI